jgi:4'-phosphopantetheinyl transferase
VWSLPTESSAAITGQFEQLLSEEEKERAGRYHFETDRRRFVLARGTLRILLSRYLDVSPLSLQFRYGPNGKPSLKNSSGVNFNLSHSGELAVFAFAAEREIGIDVERIHPLRDRADIARRFFSLGEATDLMGLSEDEQERAFFLCWTRKEAYIKATGEGVSTPLDQFRVTLTPDQPARFVHVEGSPDAAKMWMLHDLQLARGYAAALAYRDTRRPISVLPVIDSAELLASQH